MKKAYLVINKGFSIERSYKDQYQVFEDRQKAYEHFTAIGYPTNGPMVNAMGGISDQIGVMTVYYCGDVKVEFMPIEIQ